MNNKQLREMEVQVYCDDQKSTAVFEYSGIVGVPAEHIG